MLKMLATVVSTLPSPLLERLHEPSISYESPTEPMSSGEQKGLSFPETNEGGSRAHTRQRSRQQRSAASVGMKGRE